MLWFLLTTTKPDAKHHHLDTQLLICVSFGEQGGLIGLAAATVGLASEAAQHLKVNLLSP
jgi:hypothetical protein